MSRPLCPLAGSDEALVIHIHERPYRPTQHNARPPADVSATRNTFNPELHPKLMYIMHTLTNVFTVFVSASNSYVLYDDEMKFGLQFIRVNTT